MDIFGIICGKAVTGMDTFDRKKFAVPEYRSSPSGPFDHAIAFLTGFCAGAAVLFIFYKVLILSAIGGLIFGAVNTFTAKQETMKKRLQRLRAQFFDLLEAISVSIRAGNPLVTAMRGAREDLMLIYPEDSDIIVELDIIIGSFNNAVPVSEAFSDFAERSGLEDIASFASVYATIEGKSGRENEIVRETQQIIADKMEIEMEIDMLLNAAKSELNIMLLMPLVILGVIGSAGAGFMDAIYTTAAGRIVSTAGLIVFIICFVMAKRFSNVKI